MTDTPQAGDERETLLDGGAIRGLYIHFPFCARRCRYCDFTTSACPEGDPLMREYTFAVSFLARSAAVAGLCGEVKTFYLGGGTPSFIGNRNLTSLLYLLSTRMNLEDDTEFTLELNPDSFDQDLFKDLWALGVNRYSVGAQSFDDDVLARLGRIHDARQTDEVVELLSSRGANVSVDLMCGVPGQSPESFLADVAHAVALGVGHVSVYPLTIEPGTPLAQDVASGSVDDVDEDLQADEMTAADGMLAEAGLVRYETANFARPGFESRHNLGYWTGRQYLGLGTSAASMLSADNFRRLVDAGVFQTDVDLSALDDDAVVRATVVSPADQIAASMKQRVSVEVLDHASALVEQVMLRMRLAAGVSDDLLSEALEADPALAGVFADLGDKGLVTRSADSFVPTERGWLLGNEVFGAIWDTAAGD